MKIIIVLLCFCSCILTGCKVDSDIILQNSDSVQEIQDTDSDEGEREAETQTADYHKESAEDKGTEEQDLEDICVYICGAVNVPGVYILAEGDRVYQVVELAGGLTEDADEKSINLAEVVMDGQMVRIPTKEEIASGRMESEEKTGVVSSGDSGNERVNLNTAGVEELTSLNGIGKTKAEAIITYREDHGAFQSVEEIMQVDGIGEGTFAKIQDDIGI